MLKWLHNYLGRLSSVEVTNLKYCVYLLVMLSSVASLSTVVYIFRPPALNSDTLCPDERYLEAHTVVLVDRTDRWDSRIGDLLAEKISAALFETKQYEKFSIAALDGNNVASLLFEACNPGKPSWFTDIYRGRKFQENDFVNKFVSASTKVISAVKQPNTADTSPIVETIGLLVSSEKFGPIVKKRKLILISDMRQNSDKMSLYKNPRGLGFEAYFRENIGANGVGVDFEFHLVHHSKGAHLPLDKVIGIWDKSMKGMKFKYTWSPL